MDQDQIVNRLVHQVLAIRKKDSGEYCEGNLELNGFRFSKFYILDKFSRPSRDFWILFPEIGNGVVIEGCLFGAVMNGCLYDVVVKGCLCGVVMEGCFYCVVMADC